MGKKSSVSCEPFATTKDEKAEEQVKDGVSRKKKKISPAQIVQSGIMNHHLPYHINTFDKRSVSKEWGHGERDKRQPRKNELQYI